VFGFGNKNKQSSGEQNSDQGSEWNMDGVAVGTEAKENTPPPRELAMEPGQGASLKDDARFTRDPLHAANSEWAKEHRLYDIGVMAEIQAGRQNFYLIELPEPENMNKAKKSAEDSDPSKRVAFIIDNDDTPTVIMRHYNGKYLLTTDDFFNSLGTTGYEELDEGRHAVGRKHAKEDGKIEYDPTVSGDHFDVEVTKDQLNIWNKQPTNGTTLVYGARREEE